MDFEDHRPALAGAILLALTLGCAPALVGTVTTTPAGPGVQLAPREAGCSVEFHRTRPPDAAYDEIATFHLEGPWADAAAAQDALRARACAVGADAVVVTRDFTRVDAFGTSAMTGTAVSVRTRREERAAVARADAAAPEARAARERGEAEARAREAAAARAVLAAEATVGHEELLRALGAAPAGYLPASARQALAVHAGPHASSPTSATLDAGAAVWAAGDESRGFRRVRLPDGRTGFAEAKALEVHLDAVPALGAATP
jgi:hypothetical protein